jgi:hypothetical protein
VQNFKRPVQIQDDGHEEDNLREIFHQPAMRTYELFISFLAHPYDRRVIFLQSEQRSVQVRNFKLVLFILSLGVLTLAAGASVEAQQTVFNVPTTDALDQGKSYFELDVSAKPVDPEFSSFVPRLVFGAGHGIEAGVNFNGNIQPGADSTTIVPAIKWKFYDGGENGWAAAVGDNVYIPVHNKSYDFGNFSYVIIQKTFSTKTRVGFGGHWFSKDVVEPDKDHFGGHFTFEQPVNDRFGLLADWYTGKHAAGYVTTGGYYKITGKFTGYAAYSVGNQGASDGNHYFYLEAGYNFN